MCSSILIDCHIFLYPMPVCAHAYVNVYIVQPVKWNTRNSANKNIPKSYRNVTKGRLQNLKMETKFLVSSRNSRSASDPVDPVDPTEPRGIVQIH